MENLKKKRGAIKASITRLENFVKKVTSEITTIDEITSRLEKLEDWSSQFEEIQLTIENEGSTDNDNSKRQNFEEKYFSVRSNLLRIKREIINASNVERSDEDNDVIKIMQSLSLNHDVMTQTLQQITQTSAQQQPISQQGIQNNQTKNNIKLPRIEIPKFDGNFKNWPSFKDIFLSLVHNNEMLSTIEKFQLLKSSLQGEASSMLRHLLVTEANYKEAWDQLQLRYNKKRLIIDSHLQTIMSQPNLQSTLIKDFKWFFNNVTESVRALKALGVPTDSWDCCLVFVIANKLDVESKQLWARETSDIDLPSYKLLIEFLEKRMFELSTINDNNKVTMPKQGISNKNIIKPKSITYTTTSVSCPICQGNHYIFKCLSFKNLDIQQRKSVVKEKGLCDNCLNSGHTIQQCSSGNCKICQARHNTLLHTNSNDIKPLKVLSSQTTYTTEIILPTAITHITDYTGNLQPCRLLLDSGSQSTIVSEHCIQRLGLKRIHARTAINGIGANTLYSKGKAKLLLTSIHTSEKFEVEAYILNKLSSNIPTNNLNASILEDFGGLKLADPQLTVSSTIDIILGADVVFYSLRNGKLFNSSSNLIAQNTMFGWVISGKQFNENTASSVISSFHSTIDVDQQLKRFWEMEEISVANMLTDEESQCEILYMNTHQRLSDGRYEVKLPFKQEKIELGNSKAAALSRLKSIEKRFRRDPNFHQQYIEFMEEYHSLGHMQEIINDNSDTVTNKYYLPPHGVIKSDSITTKLRVVFDASKTTSSGNSLNDTLMVGPVIQSDLLSTISRFRLHKYVFAADINKMYRQIMVNRDDQNYQRILWRANANQPIKEYKLSTVTYGTACAPFLATRTLKQLADDENDKFPEECGVISNDFYVDDLLSGSNDLEHAITLARNLQQILSSGGFELRKWKSNSNILLNELSETNQESKSAFQFVTDEATKTLGLWWHPVEDYFSYQVNISGNESNTKRRILSEISKIYDPLGWVSPCIVKAKVLIQKLWILGIDWDDPVPSDLQHQWLRLRNDLQNIANIKIPRWIGSIHSAELHAFTDASETAYGAVIYLRVRGESDMQTRIISSKSKVAPLKQTTLPRLELCAAHLLIKLLNKSKKSMKLENLRCYAYTDSTIVLSWLAAHPKKWKPFVGNRTAEIIDQLPYHHWYHVSGHDNPADHVSRGLLPSQLETCELWWHGPKFLQLPDFKPQKSEQLIGDIPETRSQIFHTMLTDHSQSLIHKHSNYTNLLRITAYCLRFISNTRQPKNKRMLGSLSASELNQASTVCIKIVQQEVFKEEINKIKSNLPVSKGSPLRTLNPFIDKHDVLRVGGRLREGILSFDQKFPVILPKDHHYTNLLVSYQHIKYLHAGPRLLSSVLCKQFWIIGLRRVVRRITYKCTTCIRHRAVTCSQQMGSLPRTRITLGWPFANTGVDYAGPFSLRTWQGRGAKTLKGYICVFVCLATKALRLELVSSLTSDAFLAALKRFISRRGYCANLYSDNGTNFVGAYRELKEFYDLLKRSQPKLSTELSNVGINWNFIPPAAPHFGGLWEANVKAIKFHLKRVISNSHLTFEEMATLLCQIEAVLNSRPLSAISDDAESYDALTPNHFLIGGPIMTAPDTSLDDLKISRHNRWQHLQMVRKSFWQRWSKEYISSLQRRTKWFSPQDNLQPNSLVLIKEDNLPPGEWLMGRIQEVHPGSDGLVRVATVRTQNGILKRPIIKLCLLHKPEDNQTLESQPFKAGGMFGDH